jgi:hypothetical protein
MGLYEMPPPNIEDKQEEVPMVSPVCTYCRRILGFRHCEAFAEIPVEIWSGENLHRTPYTGDHGLTYKKWSGA